MFSIECKNDIFEKILYFIFVQRIRITLNKNNKIFLLKLNNYKSMRVYIQICF